MKRYASVVMMCMAALPALAEMQSYQADLSHTNVHFAVTHFERSQIRGRFNKIEVRELQWDAATGQGKLEVEIDPDSVDTGSRLLDYVLKGEQYFHSKEFSSIRFSASQFVASNGQLQAVHGQLTLHGQTLPLVLQAKRFTCGSVKLALITRQVCGGDFSASISRSTFGLGRLVPEVADQVQLDMSIEASPR
ncbi:MAG: polyisoprenoid-binding protein [Burkholderiales bacterium]|nr:polyisoprenoid-binding protein [Burkholderiales bacterium]